MGVNIPWSVRNYFEYFNSKIFLQEYPIWLFSLLAHSFIPHNWVPNMWWTLCKSMGVKIEYDTVPESCILERGDILVNKLMGGRDCYKYFHKSSVGKPIESMVISTGMGRVRFKWTSKKRWALSWVLKMVKVQQRDYRGKCVLSRRNTVSKDAEWNKMGCTIKGR